MRSKRKRGGRVGTRMLIARQVCFPWGGVGVLPLWGGGGGRPRRGLLLCLVDPVCIVCSVRRLFGVFWGDGALL